MKKNIALTIVFLATLVAAFIASCNKEKQEINSKDGIVSESTGEVDNMDDYLLLFRSKLNSASNSKETITLDQAQRDLGNLLNFDFGDANYPTNVYQNDTIRLNLPLVEGEVYMKDLAEAYLKSREEVSKAFNKVVLSEKSVYAIKCSITPQTRDDTDAEIQLVLITRGVAPGLLIKTSIDTTDNWHVGELMGKCDGTCVGDDHTTIIKKVFMNNRPPLDCANGRLYYTDFNNDCFFSGNYFETGSVSWNNGYMFWDGNYNDYMTHCVIYQEMQYYYNNFCQVMGDRVPEGHVFITVDCYIDHTVSIEDAEFSFFCCYTTAKPNCTNEPLE